MGDVSSSPALPPTEVICPRCDTSVPANAGFCPGCGRSTKPLPTGQRLAACSAYCTLLPATVLLLLPAYRKSPFVRFHAWQSVLLWGVFLIATLVALFLSNFIGTVALLLTGILASLAMFFLWVVLVLKSWQGEHFELPFFGRFAGRLG